MPCHVPALADRVIDALTARRVKFSTKATFGGLCVMVDEKMGLGILDTRLMVRCGETTRHISDKERYMSL